MRISASPRGGSSSSRSTRSGCAPAWTSSTWGGLGIVLQYAGAQSPRARITLSRDQHAFVSELIRAKRLPCSVECVDFLDYRPAETFDGAVFMGSLEHMPDYGYLGGFSPVT
jgi:cyclopropane fatty-acyl-phospholipid synthase-like methyltransferase